MREAEEEERLLLLQTPALEARATAAFAKRAGPCWELGEAFFAASRSLAWQADDQSDARTLTQLLHQGAAGAAAFSAGGSGAFLAEASLLSFLAAAVSQALESGALAGSPTSVGDAQHLAVAWRSLAFLEREASILRNTLLHSSLVLPALSVATNKAESDQKEREEEMAEEQNVALRKDGRSRDALAEVVETAALAEAAAAAAALSENPIEAFLLEEVAAVAAGAQPKKTPDALLRLQSAEASLQTLRASLERNLLRRGSAVSTGEEALLHSSSLALPDEALSREVPQNPAMGLAWISVALWAYSAKASSQAVSVALRQSLKSFRASTRRMERAAERAGRDLALAWGEEAAHANKEKGILCAGSLAEISQLACSLQSLAGCLCRGRRRVLHALLPAVRSLVHSLNLHLQQQASELALQEERRPQGEYLHPEGSSPSGTRRRVFGDTAFAWQCVVLRLLPFVGEGRRCRRSERPVSVSVCMRPQVFGGCLSFDHRNERETQPNKPFIQSF